MRPLHNRPFIMFFVFSVLLHICVFAVLGYLSPLTVSKQSRQMQIFIEKEITKSPEEKQMETATKLPQKEKPLAKAHETEVSEAQIKMPDPLHTEKKRAEIPIPSPQESTKDYMEEKDETARRVETIKTAEHIPSSHPEPYYTRPAEESLDDFLRRILSRIEKAKSYPVVAKRRGMQGEVVCRFIISSNGVLKDAVVLSSSAHSILDRAALDAIKRASPYPAFPEFYTEDVLTSSVTIKFELN